MRVPLRAAVLMTLVAAGASAGVTGRGTEFWACWPRSHLSLETSAELIVMADDPTTVEVDGAFAFGPAAVGPGRPVVIPLPDTLRVSAERLVVPAGFRIRTLDPLRPIIVTLRVPRLAEASDDTARLLPIEELGTRYVAMSYEASLPGEPSLYAIVATQDGTTVDAAVPCRAATDTVLLDAGDVYQVTCQWQDAPNDVSGAVITADKPIAVLAGNSDAFVPAGYLSGDFVLEALPPSASWGTHFFVVPSLVGPAAVDPHDVVRLVSDGATCDVDDGTGLLNLALPPRIPRSIDVRLPTEITCTAPVSAWQFATGYEVNDMGDPFQAEIPALENWGLGARAYLPPNYSLGNFLTIVTDVADTQTIQLDGVNVPAWTSFPSGTHAWSTVAMGSGGGEHLITGAGPLTVLAHGYNAEYLGDPGLGRTPGSHATPAALAAPSCIVAPTIASGTSSCTGAVLDLRAGATSGVGCAQLEYRWLRNGVEIPGCGFSANPDCTTTFQGDANYALEVRCATNPDCTGLTAQVLYEEPAPPVVIVPDDALICPDSPLVLDASLGFRSYAWTSDVPDQGVTPVISSLNAITVTPSQDTTYSVLATDIRGCTSTASVTIRTVADPIPPALGKTVRVSKAGGPDLRIRWQDLVGFDVSGYETVVLECSSRDHWTACPLLPPNPTNVDRAPVVGFVAPGVQEIIHRGAFDLGDLLCYRVRALSPCGRRGPTCNPWPMQVPPCP
jgi:hypothetical protein